MVTESEIWECVKKNNSFLVKRSQGSNKAQFSAEPGNLYNLNTFKYSGLANSKTIDIATDKSDAKNRSIIVSKSTKKGGVAKFTLKKNATKMLKTITKETEGFRSDLVVRGAPAGGKGRLGAGGEGAGRFRPGSGLTTFGAPFRARAARRQGQDVHPRQGAEDRPEGVMIH